MKRYDLRNSKNLLFDIENTAYRINENEVAIIMFSPGIYDDVENCVKLLQKQGLTIFNSLRFNQVDWEIVAKREKK